MQLCILCREWNIPRAPHQTLNLITLFKHDNIQANEIRSLPLKHVEKQKTKSVA